MYLATLLLLALQAPAAAPCPSAPWASQPQPRFEDHFQPVSVRLDLSRWVEGGAEKVKVDGFFQEGPWAGNPHRPVDHSRYGEHELRVRDQQGQLLYSRAFSSLFAEWRTTEEALAGKPRLFQESLRFPRPKQPVTLELVTRDRKGGETLVWSYSYLGRLDGLTPKAPGVAVLDLHRGDADPTQNLDILLVADGYDASQQAKLRADLRRFADALLAAPAFAAHRDQVSIRALAYATDGSGPAEPRKKLKGGSRVGATFNTFGSERYLTVGDDRALQHLAALAPQDTLVVLVNTARYGGAGIFRSWAVFPSDNDFDDYVFIHEFGHSFGGLGDEYYSSSVAYNEFYPKGFEPWEPNITALLDGPDSAKWDALLDEGVPVPTPERPEFSSSTGVFEGAGYSARGLYRPALDCIMFSKKVQGFCKVCGCALEWMIMEEVSQDVR
jgi:hypothetical protein